MAIVFQIPCQAFRRIEVTLQFVYNSLILLYFVIHKPRRSLFLFSKSNFATDSELLIICILDDIKRQPFLRVVNLPLTAWTFPAIIYHFILSPQPHLQGVVYGALSGQVPT
jgi:hypothetical protein